MIGFNPETKRRQQAAFFLITHPQSVDGGTGKAQQQRQTVPYAGT
jgi:hypothetical protein